MPRNFFPSLLGGRKTKSSASVSAGAEAELSVSGSGSGRSGRGRGSTSGAGTGSLNPMKQLEAAYASVLKSEGDDEAWRKEFFQKVRILVLGRSGVGKTTLIRLMVGKEGPQSVSDGTAGVQNINKEFLYSSEGVPLLIHDSNGMDVKGKERVDEIKAFLDKHQRGDDFTERIHIVWYVISAIDARCVDDGDVMKMISEYKIPLLLVMTHSDYHGKIKVTDAVLDRLLQSAYPEDRERAAVKEVMVKVSNDGVSVGGDNELVIDESKRDTAGLKQVAKRTYQLMDKKLRYTWIAAQAVDTEGKLHMSAGIIAGYARRALFTSIPRIIPLADPLKLAIIFCRVTIIMCRIWAVTPELKEALNQTLKHKEVASSVIQRVVQDLTYTAGVVISVATVGLALPAVKSKMGGLPVTVLVKEFSLKVLGTILYVKSAQAGRSTQRWKPGVSKADYLELCQEFLHNADYQQRLLDFAKKQHSTIDTAVRTKKVQDMITAQIVDMYQRLLLHRPNSLFSQMSKDDDNIIDETLNDIERCVPAKDTTRRVLAKSQRQRPQVHHIIEPLKTTSSHAPTNYHQQPDQVPYKTEPLKITSSHAPTKYRQQPDQVPYKTEPLNITSSRAPTNFCQQPDQVPYKTENMNITTRYGPPRFHLQPDQVPDNTSTGQNTEPIASRGDYDYDDYDEGEHEYDEGEEHSDEDDVMEYME